MRLAWFDVLRGSTMDIRIIYLPSGGLAETHGNVVRLTTPSAGALAAHRLTRREIQEATVAEAEVAVGRKLVPASGGSPPPARRPRRSRRNWFSSSDGRQAEESAAPGAAPVAACMLAP